MKIIVNVNFYLTYKIQCRELKKLLKCIEFEGPKIREFIYLDHARICASKVPGHCSSPVMTNKVKTKNIHSFSS